MFQFPTDAAAVSLETIPTIVYTVVYSPFISLFLHIDTSVFYSLIYSFIFIFYGWFDNLTVFIDQIHVNVNIWLRCSCFVPRDKIHPLKQGFHPASAEGYMASNLVLISFFNYTLSCSCANLCVDDSPNFTEVYLCWKEFEPAIHSCGILITLCNH